MSWQIFPFLTLKKNPVLSGELIFYNLSHPLTTILWNKLMKILQMLLLICVFF